MESGPLQELSLKTLSKGAWINIVNPTPYELKVVSTLTEVDPDFLRSALDDEERSHTDIEDDSVMILTNVPVYRGEDSYDTLPLAIILTDEHVITVCLEETPVMAEFNERTAKLFRTYKRTRFLFQILYKSDVFYLRYLRQISKLSEEIEDRLIPGHWEGDLIKGAYNRSAVGVLVERHSRYLILCKMDDGTAEAALEGFTRQMKKMPAFMRKSLTYDRGSEMACFRQLSERLNIDIWFCDPHAPWQRGSNENTNGLLRQFLPKGMDLSTISQTRLNDIARLMNGRPRLALDAQTPDEVMTKILDDYARPLVALDS